MGDSSLLPELSEGQSQGAVEALYSDIRATLGVPFVGLVYRTLAVEPGRLEATWKQLRPLLAHPATWKRASELDPGLSRVPPIAPLGGRSRADPRFEDRAAATLAAYDHMNRLNLLGLSALHRPREHAIAGPPRAGVPAPRAVRWQPDDLLPMPALDSLPAEDLDLLLLMSESLLGSANRSVVPSLLRHFAVPGELRPLWQAIRPAVEAGFVAKAAAGLRRQALAVPLPPGVAIELPADPAIAAVAATFLVATSTMVVTGALLERALAA